MMFYLFLIGYSYNEIQQKWKDVVLCTPEQCIPPIIERHRASIDDIATALFPPYLDSELAASFVK